MFKQVTADNILNWGGRLNRLPGAQRSMGDSEGHKYWGVEPQPPTPRQIGPR